MLPADALKSTRARSGDGQSVWEEPVPLPAYVDDFREIRAGTPRPRDALRFAAFRRHGSTGETVARPRRAMKTRIRKLRLASSANGVTDLLPADRAATTTSTFDFAFIEEGGEAPDANFIYAKFFLLFVFLHGFSPKRNIQIMTG